MLPQEILKCIAYESASGGFRRPHTRAKSLFDFVFFFHALSAGFEFCICIACSGADFELIIYIRLILQCATLES